MEDSFNSKEENSFGGEDLIIQPLENSIIPDAQAKRKASNNTNEIPLRPSELRESTVIQPQCDSSIR